MNTDCLLLILQQIPPGDRSQYRLVSHQWCTLIDYLSFSQKSLHFYSSQLNHNLQLLDGADYFSWPHQNFSYSEFIKVFKQYPNLRELVFTGFMYWNDHHFTRLTELCKSIESLAFYSCPYLSENYFNNFGFQNLTQIGWQTIALHYANLNTLILEDCDLENYYLGPIVESFRCLRHLNIANNSEINNFSPLSNLPSTLEVLKLGPKLSVDCKKALYKHHEMPIDAIVAGSGQNIRELQLQGFLTPKLNQLQHLPKLEHLVVKYASFTSEKDIFSLEVEVLTSAVANLKQLRQLDLYQVNQANCCIDLHWMRQRLSSVLISSNLLQPNLPNLRSFSLHSTTVIVVDQFRLVNFILPSTPNLSTFSLNCAIFDPNLHYNHNQTILVLLQKYGSKLTELKLENLLPTSLYSYLAYVLLTSPNLLKFTIEDREMATFLYCMDMQIDQLLANDKLTTNQFPLDLTFSMPTLLKMVSCYNLTF